jgi:hypothetical protein
VEKREPKKKKEKKRRERPLDCSYARDFLKRRLKNQKRMRIPDLNR